MIQAYPFVSNPDPQYIRKDIEEKPVEFLKDLLLFSSSFGVDEVTRRGVFKYMGYCYDLRPYLKHFVYKHYGGWHESYALNKTNLRKLTHGKIDKIIQL